jgi:hypothetical protein
VVDVTLTERPPEEADLPREGDVDEVERGEAEPAEREEEVERAAEREEEALEG